MRFHDNITERKFDDIEFAEYLFRSSQLESRRSDDFRHRQISASFTAWQMLTAQGMDKGWADYLDTLGLVEKQDMGAEARKKMAERSITIAERIRKSHA